MGRSPRTAILLAVLVGAAGPVWAQSVKIGTTTTAGNANCIPFACPNYWGVRRYQQVFTSTAFSGPFLIGSIRFFNTFWPGNFASGNFTIKLSTSSKTLTGMSATLNNNLGGNTQTFFTGFLSGSTGTAPTFAGITPFLYDPSMGNLLMEIGYDGPGADGFLTYLDTTGPGPECVTTRAYGGASGQAAGIDACYGLVTEFDMAVATQVTHAPEPITLTLLATGLAGLGGAGLLRRRRTLGA